MLDAFNGGEERGEEGGDLMISLFGLQGSHMKKEVYKKRDIVDHNKISTSNP